MSDSTRSAGPPSASASRSGAAIVHEVHLEQSHALHRLGRQQVDADHDSLGPHLLRTTCAQPPRRDAEVHHPAPRLEQAEALVELDQLVGRARLR